MTFDFILTLVALLFLAGVASRIGARERADPRDELSAPRAFFAHRDRFNRRGRVWILAARFMVLMAIVLLASLALR